MIIVKWHFNIWLKGHFEKICVNIDEVMEGKKGKEYWEGIYMKKT